MSHALKNWYINILLLWIALSATAVLSKNISLLIATIALTGALPFIYVVMWLSISPTGKRIRDSLKILHWAAMLSFSAFLYSTYAKSWAASTINSIFNVDPSLLPITQSFISFLFAPISLLYHESILSASQAITIFVAICLVNIIPIALIANISFRKILKFSGILFGSVFLMSFFLSIAFNLSAQIKNLTAEFALATDFNQKHLCSDEWASKAESLLFLGGENVLVYYPSNPKGQKFIKETCNFKKSF
ncbi:hypothetical protein HBN76_14475 [Pseudomonas sp. WS 5013]|uniref:hypothetical protein n=1 Tax=Pseudomonas sp. WS 5013 TaxID=2717475 RepID=UPI001472854B|nr:hypothetical protein [Pseudomonas sp. WS 5013]NMY42524.1 hypothetical protein [Pseudomonas sp. WS 5013]